MKKYILILTILSTISLVGCGHEHTFSDATCTDPKICTECQETEGTALDHNWIDATCENPKTCSLCNITEGNPLNHNWIDATMESPKTCSLCNLTEGEPLAPDSGVDSAGTSVTLEPDEYKGDDEVSDEELTESMEQIMEEGLISQEDFDMFLDALKESTIEESTPSVNVTINEEGLPPVTDGQGGSGRAYGEAANKQIDTSQFSGYRID